MIHPDDTDNSDVKVVHNEPEQIETFSLEDLFSLTSDSYPREEKVIVTDYEEDEAVLKALKRRSNRKIKTGR